MFIATLVIKISENNPNTYQWENGKINCGGFTELKIIQPYNLIQPYKIIKVNYYYM